jgi:UDP-N-acetylmuramoyl-L-alanyl-D-glutamate--2,6-diaminopimelate ligase
MMALLVTAMTLGELLGAAAGSHSALTVTDLTQNSREVVPGAAFIAVQGSQTHGLRYAADALQRGAAIVLYEPAAGLEAPALSLPVVGLRSQLGELARRFYGRGRPQPTLFGVTGTNGKTTVAYLLAQSMQQLGARCAYLGTLGYGVLPDLHPQALTTPDCLSLHRELRSLEVSHAAMEVSSHALEQGRIAGLEFSTAALTNLSRDHLDHHLDMAAYGAAKQRLFDAPGLTDAVLNIDDAFAASLAPALSGRLRLTTTSLRAHSQANLRGVIRQSSLRGFVLAVDYAGRPGRVRSRLIGEFNAENMLVALGALLAWDIPLQDACAALSACAPVPGRIELIEAAAAKPMVVVDYAHTPAALERVLSAVRVHTRGQLWCVFGCGGERDRGKRPLMGAIAARLADHVILTDDNPRSESPAAIVAAIRGGIEAGREVRIEHDRAAAIRSAIEQAAAGDVVLIAGKGHESTQTGADGVRAFSDRSCALEALGSAA